MATSGNAPIRIYKPDGSLQTKIFGRVAWKVEKVLANRDFWLNVKFDFWKASGTTSSSGVALGGGYTFNLWGDSDTNYFDQGKFDIPGGGGIGTGYDATWYGVLPPNTSNKVRFRSINAQISGSTVMKNISFDFEADITVPAGFAGNMANFTDEQYFNINVPINNPSGLNCSVYEDHHTGGNTYNTSQKSGGFKIPYTDADRNKVYAFHSTVKTVPFKFRIHSTVPGFSSIYQEKTATMSIVNANPVFSNFKCYDSNIKTAGLLDEDENVFINNQSNMKVDVLSGNKMTFKKGATGQNAKYIASFKTLSKTANYSTSLVSMDFSKIALATSATGISAVNVTAYDSRANTTTATKNITVIDWQNPNPVLKIERTNPFATSINVQISSGTFSPVKYKDINRNKIKKARFSYKEKSASTYSGATDFTITQSADGKFSSNNMTLSEFNVNKEYDFKIEIEDELVLYTTYHTLPKGQPNCFIGVKDNNSIITVGKLPDLSLPNGSIDVLGGIYANGEEYAKCTQGTFVPTTNMSYGTPGTFSYVKIGNIYYISGAVVLKAPFVASTTVASLGGLPNQNKIIGGSGTVFSNGTVYANSASTTTYAMTVGLNFTNVGIRFWIGTMTNGATRYAQHYAFKSNQNLSVSGWYIIDNN